MRRLTLPLAVLLTLSFAACGGGDDTTSATAGASGTSGPQGSTGDSEMTASEFVDASLPDEIEAVEAAVAANPDCSGADPKPGGDFQVNVAIDAAGAPPDTPISEVVADNC